MTIGEALELALAKENASIQLYKKLAVEHSAIRELLMFLSDEEHKHKKMIEKKIFELTK